MSLTRKIISSRFLYNDDRSLPYPPSQISQIKEVKAKLLSGEFRFIENQCPCGANQEDLIIAEIDRYGLPIHSILCRICGIIRTNPYLDEPSLNIFYSQYYQDMYARAINLEGYFRMQNVVGKNILSMAQRFLKPGGFVCEIGCGAGGSLKIFQNNGYQTIGCDYSSKLIEYGKVRNVSNIYVETVQNLSLLLKEQKVDFIYLHHVFEHLSEPLAFLEICKNYLTPSGRVLIVVPDISTIDKFPNPAGDSLLYLNLAHKYTFTVKGICEMAKRVGLKPTFASHCMYRSSGELWVEISMPEANGEAISKEDEEINGDILLNYLLKTEKKRSLGLCRGQFLKLIQNIRTWSTQKIKKIMPNIILNPILRYKRNMECLRESEY